MSRHRKQLLVLFLLPIIEGCFFFRDKNIEPQTESEATAVLGIPLTDYATGPNETDLDALYAITSTEKPASIRPDPDLFVRRLLLQYRNEGSTVAQEIGRVEEFRILLGGASEDFATTPQESYDATSLLATYKVSEEVCQGLVAPSQSQHPGWTSILPFSSSEKSENIEWLAQRILGVPTDEIPADTLSRLGDIATTYEEFGDVSLGEYGVYIPVCATLLLDAEALLL